MSDYLVKRMSALGTINRLALEPGQIAGVEEHLIVPSIKKSTPPATFMVDSTALRCYSI